MLVSSPKLMVSSQEREEIFVHLCKKKKKNSKLNSLYLMPLIDPTECYAYIAEYLLIADIW